MDVFLHILARGIGLKLSIICRYDIYRTGLPVTSHDFTFVNLCGQPQPAESLSE